MNIHHFSSQNQDKAVFNIQGQGGQTVVNQGLGKDGELLVNELDGGRALELQLTGVHHAACPALATVLHQVAEEIHNGATGGLVEVESGQRTYNAIDAEQQ